MYPLACNSRTILVHAIVPALVSRVRPKSTYTCNLLSVDLSLPKKKKKKNRIEDDGI